MATARPTLATSLPDFDDNLELADLGRFWSGGTNLDQLWAPALPWPIWAMALLILGGQRDFGRARPIWANLATRLDWADFCWPDRFGPTDPPPLWFGPPPGSDRPPPDRPPPDHPKFHSFFSFSRRKISFFSSLSGVFSLNFGGVFEAPGRSNVHVWVLGAVV